MAHHTDGTVTVPPVHCRKTTSALGRRGKCALDPTLIKQSASLPAFVFRMQIFSLRHPSPWSPGHGCVSELYPAFLRPDPIISGAGQLYQQKWMTDFLHGENQSSEPLQRRPGRREWPGFERHAGVACHASPGRDGARRSAFPNNSSSGACARWNWCSRARPNAASEVPGALRQRHRRNRFHATRTGAFDIGMTRVMDRLALRGGLPKVIRSDNDEEFFGQAREVRVTWRRER